MLWAGESAPSSLCAASCEACGAESGGGGSALPCCLLARYIPSLPRMPDPHVDIMLTRGTACVLSQAAAQQQLETELHEVMKAISAHQSSPGGPTQLHDNGLIVSMGVSETSIEVGQASRQNEVSVEVGSLSSR
eukprot:COSAG01_NODE_2365_length_7818_cov_13.978754_7_plen_134_part_00